jgi:hypothetical protein
VGAVLQKGHRVHRPGGAAQLREEGDVPWPLPPPPVPTRSLLMSCGQEQVVKSDFRSLKWSQSKGRREMDQHMGPPVHSTRKCEHTCTHDSDTCSCIHTHKHRHILTQAFLPPREFPLCPRTPGRQPCLSQRSCPVRSGIHNSQIPDDQTTRHLDQRYSPG